MTEPTINGNFSHQTYVGSDGSVENISLLGASTKLGNTNLSIGMGNDSYLKDDGTYSNKPIFEAKVKQNFNNNLNAQFRFRETGGVEQYRATVGGSYAFDNQNSIYGAVHATAKNKNDIWSYNTGAWVGYTHNFGKASLSVEAQQNIALNGNRTNLGSFNDGNKYVNVILSIPF